MQHRHCWQALIAVLLITGGALAQLTPRPGADRPLDTNSTQQHCSRRDMCSAGISCQTGLAGTEPSRAFRVCADKAQARGYVSRCFYDYESGAMCSVLFCPRGQTGAWPGSVAIAKAEIEQADGGVTAASVGPQNHREVTADASLSVSSAHGDAGSAHGTPGAAPVSRLFQPTRSRHCSAGRGRVSDEPWPLAFLSIALAIGTLRRKAH